MMKTRDVQASVRAGGEQAEPDPAAVTVRDLWVSLGGRHVLHGLGFQRGAGTITGLLGPSGCGKTTLMRVLVGVQRYQGRVRVLGLEPGSTQVRGRLGYMTQETAVYTDLSARQNLRYFARLAGERARDVDEVLEVVGLGALADRAVRTYSGGEASRVSLACALIGAPDLLVLDEPTVGLDPVTREQLWGAFHQIARCGTTLLVSSHVMDEAFRCDTVLLMRDGRILADTTAPDLLSSTGAPSLDQAFLDVIRSSATGARTSQPATGREVQQ